MGSALANTLPHNRKLNAVVDRPLTERQVTSREDQTPVNSLAKLSSARVNSLFAEQNS